MPPMRVARHQGRRQNCSPVTVGVGWLENVAVVFWRWIDPTERLTRHLEGLVKIRSVRNLQAQNGLFESFTPCEPMKCFMQTIAQASPPWNATQS